MDIVTGLTIVFVGSFVMFLILAFHENGEK